MSNSNQRPWYKDPRILIPAIVAILVAIIGGIFAIIASFPQTPTGPIFKEIGGDTDADGDYEISWERAIRATSYVLQEDIDPSFTSPRTVYSGTETKKFIYGKSDGDYYYRVRGCNDAGESEWSPIRKMTVRLSTSLTPILTPTITPGPTPTPTPAATPTSTPVIYQALFDETRLQEKGEGTYYNKISETAACGGSNFSKLLEDNGFHVSNISTKPIEYKELKKYHVLILFSSGDPSDFNDYTDDEIDAIEKFVKEGGGLFLTRESWKGTAEKGTGLIAERFGVSFARDGEICDAENNYRSDLKNIVKIFVDDNSDASLNTKKHVYLVSGTYITHTGSSKVLAYTDSDAWFDRWDEQEDGTRVKKIPDNDEKNGPFPVLSVMDYGGGRVVFMGDKSLFTNCWLDHFGNKDLGLNIVKWLVKNL